MFIDTHAHINGPAAGVDKMIRVGTSLDDSQTAVELAQKYDNIFATVGIHPIDGIAEISNWDKFIKLLKQSKVVGVGECGLDYHEMYVSLHDRDKKPTPDFLKKQQKELFQKQIFLAKDLDLPLIIHIRDAWEDGVFHCFSGNQEQLEFVLDLGFYISFAGNITFKNARGSQESAKSVPLDRLLLETDSPYLAPEPLRGTQNKPENVKMVAQKLADIKGLTLEEVAIITSNNARKLFALPLRAKSKGLIRYE